MSKRLKIALMLFAVVLLAAVVAVVLIQTQLTPERIRATVLPIAERHLGRSVQLGEIRIGLFSGIRISDLVINEPDSSEVFFSVGEAELSYRLWSLLKGQLDIRDILFDQPSVTIIRFSDGRFNFSDLLSEPSRSDSPPTADHSSEAFEAPLDLLIQRIGLKDGQITFIDRQINPTAPFRYSFTQVNLNIRRLSFDKDFPLDASAVFNNARLDVSARIDPARRAGDGVLHLSSLDLIPFAPYYRSALPGTLGSAQLELNLDLDWNPERVISRGRVLLDKVDMVVREAPKWPLRGVRLGADYSVRYDLGRKLLDISTLQMSYNEIGVALQGQLDLSVTDPYLDATLSLTRFDLRNAVQSLPQSLTRDLQSFSPAGEVSGRLRLLGSVGKGVALLESAQFKLTDVQATIDTIRSRINGDVSFAQGALTAQNLQLNFSDQQARLGFELHNLLSAPVSGSFQITARELDLNRLLPQTDTQASTDAPPTAGVANEPGPYDLPLTLSGTLEIERLLYRRLTISQLRGAINLNNNRLSIDPLTGKVADGEFSFNAKMNLGVKGLAYQGEILFDQSDFNSLLKGVFPQVQETLTGRAVWHNRFSGTGTLAGKALQSLQLDGDIHLLQGTVGNSPVLAAVALFLDSSELRNVSFRDFKGKYRVRDGRAGIDGNLDGARVNIIPKGTIGLDGRLDLTLTTRLAPEVLAGMGASDKLKQAFVDGSGWGLLPLTVTGNLTGPRVAFDTTALQKRIVDQTKQEVTERVLERLPPETQENQEPLRNLLDNTLRKLRVQ